MAVYSSSKSGNDQFAVHSLTAFVSECRLSMTNWPTVVAILAIVSFLWFRRSAKGSVASSSVISLKVLIVEDCHALSLRIVADRKRVLVVCGHSQIQW